MNFEQGVKNYFKLVGYYEPMDITKFYETIQRKTPNMGKNPIRKQEPSIIIRDYNRSKSFL